MQPAYGYEAYKQESSAQVQPQELHNDPVVAFEMEGSGGVQTKPKPRYELG